MINEVFHIITTIEKGGAENQLLILAKLQKTLGLNVTIIYLKGQPDLKYGGTFFSLLIIYLINLFIVTALLLLTAPQATLANYWNDISSNSIDFVSFTSVVLQQIGVLLRPLMRKVGWT